jgi:ring-1,2-phenylacetyl-CoA epoxidase subunit PaaC
LTGDDPDRIAFGRPPEAYRHAALMNHPRTDWAFTVARRFLYEAADAVRLEALSRSSDAEIAGLAVKMRREETYHLLHWSALVRRLAEGGAETRDRLGAALLRLWPEAETIFAPLDGEARLVETGILPEPMSVLRDRWVDRAHTELVAQGLPTPTASRAGAEGRQQRTDDFRWLWGEFTTVSGSEPGATW